MSRPDIIINFYSLIRSITVEFPYLFEAHLSLLADKEKRRLYFSSLSLIPRSMLDIATTMDNDWLLCIMIDSLSVPIFVSSSYLLQSYQDQSADSASEISHPFLLQYSLDC